MCLISAILTRTVFALSSVGKGNTAMHTRFLPSPPLQSPPASTHEDDHILHFIATPSADPFLRRPFLLSRPKCKYVR